MRLLIRIRSLLRLLQPAVTQVVEMMIAPNIDLKKQ
jgi:hypothetical protein